MNGRKLLISLFLIFILLQGSISQVRADQWDNILIAKKITIGMDTTYAPFQWVENSQLVGYEIDLSMRIGEVLGVTVEIITSDWDPIIPNLQNGDFDIIMSAMTITPERQNIIDFSIPYFKDTLGLLVQLGNPLSIKSINDANSTTVKIGYVSGTNTEVWILSNLPNAQKLSFNSNLNLYQALTNGDVDVIISAWYTIGRDINTGILDGEIVDYGFGEDSSFGIGVQKGEVRFLAILNDAITTMLFDGTYANITNSWFGQPGLIGTTDVDSVTISETEISTITYSVTETSLEVTTSTFIDSKAEVLFNPMISWVLLIIGLPAYVIIKRK